jgi:hypothetical protein
LVIKAQSALQSGGGGDGGNLVLSGGDQFGGNFDGQVVLLSTLSGTDGYFLSDLEICGKLTVAGLIDPTGMVFAHQASAPGIPVGGESILWVDSDGYMILSDTGGDNIVFSQNGTIASALQSATTTIDVAAATAPITGQVLTATSGTVATWQSPSATIAAPKQARLVARSQSTSNTSSISFTLVDAPHRKLIAIVFTEDTVTADKLVTATYNSKVMKWARKPVETQNGTANYYKSHIFYLDDGDLPAAGAYNFVFTMSGTVAKYRAVLLEFADADPGLPEMTSDATSGTGDVQIRPPPAGQGDLLLGILTGQGGFSGSYLGHSSFMAGYLSGSMDFTVMVGYTAEAQPRGTLSAYSGTPPFVSVTSRADSTITELLRISAWVDRTRRAPNPQVINAGVTNSVANTTSDWSVTTTAAIDAPARKLLVWLAWRSTFDTDTVTGMTCTGNAMTQVGSTLTYFNGMQGGVNHYNKFALFYADDSIIGVEGAVNQVVATIGNNSVVTITACWVLLQGATQGAVGASTTQIISLNATNSINITPSVDSSLLLSGFATDAPQTGSSTGMVATGIDHGGYFSETPGVTQETSTTEYLESGYGHRPLATDDQQTVTWVSSSGTGNGNGQIAVTIAPYWSE